MFAWLVWVAVAGAGELHLCAHKDVSGCKSACEQGHGASCARYARMLSDGIYDRLEKDESQAAKIWQKSCDLGWAAGCNRLGRLYDEGDAGLPKDASKASALYEKACGMDDASACWNLGVGFDDANQVATARRYYDKACKLGASDACIELGAMYETGDGAEKNWDKMWDHYARAFTAPSEAETTVVGCPEGTRTYRAEVSYGWEIEVYCARPTGRRATKHGPYLRWATEEDEAEGRPHGVITQLGAYTEGKKSGRWVYFDERGRKEKEGDFVADAEQGEWIRYDPESGAVRDTVPYEAGRRVGAVEEATSDGGKRVGAYLDGKKDGPWVETNADGELVREEHFAMGTRVGVHVRYYRGRKRSETPYSDTGEKHGVQRDFHQDGSLERTTVWVNGALHGPSEAFNEAGKRVRLETFAKGKPAGPFETWTYDGEHLTEKGTLNGDRDWYRGAYARWDGESHELVEQGSYDEEGERVGDWTYFGTDGKKQTELVYDPPGCLKAARTYRTNGKPADKGSYASCDREGKWVQYHDNGKIRSEGSYSAGNPVGPWTHWYDCGHKESEGAYDAQGYRTGRWTEWAHQEPHAKTIVEYDANGDAIEPAE